MGGSSNRKKNFADINVTPLVDVMLVLLIIFMVTAPMMQQGININLPKVTTNPLDLPEQPVIVSLTKSNQIYINKAKVKKKDLVRKLKYILSKRKDKSIYLKADERIPYGNVVKLMGMLYKSGITNIGIITEPETKR